MVHVNLIIPLIKYVERKKSCHFTLSLAHRKLCLYVESQTFSTNTNNIKRVCLESNNDEAKVDSDKRESLRAKKKKEQKEYVGNTRIKDYVRGINPRITEIFPDKYMRFQSSSVDTLYLFEEETAKRFVDLIIDDLSKNMTYVAEANPGTGLLTTELLKAGVTNLHAYEPNEYFYPMLHKLQRIYPDRFHIIRANLFKMSKLYYIDCKDDGERVKAVFMNVKSMPWENKSCMQVIGAVADFVFIKHLILCIVFQSCFMARGRTCFYLAIPPSFWNVLNSHQSNARKFCRYVLFQTFFDCKYFGDLKRKSYVPWQKEKLLPRQISLRYDHEIFCVVKIEPKANLFTDYLKSTELLPFWYFVKHHTTSKSQRVIPELEKWIPGCGIRLITKNYNIFTRFIDLTPNEILSLYKEFASWPEYETSLFLPSANTYLQTINQNTSISCIFNNILDV